MTSFYVYIVKCSDGSYYTGITNSLEHRIKQHNGEFKGGAKYTMSKRPVVLKYSEEVGSRSEATKREYEIKSMDHYDKEILIEKGSGQS